MIDRDSIETAYCFFHQKYQVYHRSTLDWQRDDIEFAISSYVASMNPDLYERLSAGDKTFLLSHDTFEQDLSSAVTQLEHLLP